MIRSPSWLRVGWRNLGRNPRRTVVTAGGLAVGYFAVVGLIGWVDGLTAEMVENSTGLMTGQIKIQASDYQPDESLYDTIGGRDGIDVSDVLQTITADPAVVGVAPRVYAGGLISSGEATSAGMIMGIDPDYELSVTRFLRELADGRLPRPDVNEVAIGAELARQLAVHLGDEVVLVSQGADGSMGNDLYEVVGTVSMGLPELDAAVIVLSIQTLQELIVLDPGRIHEVLVTTVDPFVASDVALRLASGPVATAADVDVMGWTEFQPSIMEYVALVGSFYGMIFAVVFGMAAFGVANTMLMATFERRREFAVMLALGTAPRHIVLSVLAESLAMGFVSLVVGAGFTIPIVLWLHNYPLDLSWLYSGITFEGTLISPTIRMEYDISVWLQSALALLVTSILAALYPAARASRIAPADTLSEL